MESYGTMQYIDAPHEVSLPRFLHNYARPRGNKVFWELSTINITFNIQLSLSGF